MDFFGFFTFIMYLECQCFVHFFMFCELFNFIIDLLITTYIGLLRAYSIIIENHLPIKGQRYERRYVCVFWFEYKYK